MITKHHFNDNNGNRVSVYAYEGKYRYTVDTPYGIEYREIRTSFAWNLIDSIEALEACLNEDILLWPYGEQQLKLKCIRCSKHHGAPRKDYNLAPICNRCYEAMEDGNVEYSINTDGSKGSVVK